MVPPLSRHLPLLEVATAIDLVFFGVMRRGPHLRVQALFIIYLLIEI